MAKTTQDFINQAVLKHNDMYDYSKVKYESSWNKIVIICKKHGEFKQAPANHLKGQNCPQCAAIEKFKTIRFTNEIIDDYLMKNKNSIKRCGDYKNSSTKIVFECLVCNEKWNTPPNSIRQGVGCPNCNDRKLLSNDVDSFICKKKLQIKRVDNYVNSYTKIRWECLLCNNIWKAQPCEIMRSGNSKGRVGSGCPKCACGKNERIVGEVLDELDIKHEKVCIIINNKKRYPDYYIPQHNLIIEYNGIQHYQPTCFGSMSMMDSIIQFKAQQVRDLSVRAYCHLHKINLLEIDGRAYKSNRLRKFVTKYFNKGERK